MLEIKLFGTLSVNYNGQPVTRFPGKRVKDLLSYLLLQRDMAHPREQLAGVLWSDLDDRKARHCLNTALWRLNQVLTHPGEQSHPYLRVGIESIGFNTASEFRLDVADFEAYCLMARELGSSAPQQQAALYGQAIALYSADLLLDCYDDWCSIERERLSRLYARALDTLVAYHTRCGEHDIAIDYALRLLTMDPLREEVQRDLVQLYLVTGQPAAALQQYRTCEDLIHRELGVEPMAETRALLPCILSKYERRPLARTSRSTNNVEARLDTILETLHAAAASFQNAYSQLMEVTRCVQAVVDDVEREGIAQGRIALDDQYLDGQGRVINAIQRLEQRRESA